MTATQAHDGAYRYATDPGASATFAFTGAYAVALLSSTGINKGLFDVYLDGVRLTPTSLDVYAPIRSWRRIVFTVETTPGSHTLRVRAAGADNPAAADTKVPVDALVLLK